MVYNRFTYILFFRVGLILVNLIGIATIYDRADLIYTWAFLIVLAIVQVFFLVAYINTTNRELTKFVLSVKDSDNTAKFPDGSGSFNELFRSFEQVLDLLKSHETQKEAQLQYIQHIVNEIEIGIVSLDADHKIALSNRTANHIRERYNFESGGSFVNTLLASGSSSIVRATSQVWGTKELMINSTQIKLLDQQYSVYTLKDIKTQLEAREIESWQKLIRILAHEIMNSVTPISSLSETTLSIIEKQTTDQKLEGKHLENVRFSLDTIKSRSEGLLNFLEDYRKLIKLPKPKHAEIEAEIFFNDIIRLFDSELNKKQISIETKLDITTMWADKIQLEQVVVNLLTNAIQAIEKVDSKHIHIHGFHNDQDCFIEVKDTGPGIDPKKLEKIFVPFYTTKPTGSGIGLSLSRQIINLHGGRLDVASEPENTVFTIQIPIQPSQNVHN